MLVDRELKYVELFLRWIDDNDIWFEFESSKLNEENILISAKDLRILQSLGYKDPLSGNNPFICTYI